MPAIEDDPEDADVPLQIVQALTAAQHRWLQACAVLVLCGVLAGACGGHHVRQCIAALAHNSNRKALKVSRIPSVLGLICRVTSG